MLVNYQSKIKQRSCGDPQCCNSIGFSALPLKLRSFIRLVLTEYGLLDSRVVWYNETGLLTFRSGILGKVCLGLDSREPDRIFYSESYFCHNSFRFNQKALEESYYIIFGYWLSTEKKPAGARRRGDGAAIKGAGGQWWPEVQGQFSRQDEGPCEYQPKNSSDWLFLYRLKTHCWDRPVLCLV